MNCYKCRKEHIPACREAFQGTKVVGSDQKSLFLTGKIDFEPLNISSFFAMINNSEKQ